MKKRHRMGLWMMAAMVCLAASGCGPAVQNKPEEPTQTIQSTQEQPTQTAEGDFRRESQGDCTGACRRERGKPVRIQH